MRGLMLVGLTALCGSANAALIDFDGLAPGTALTQLQGVDFSSNIGLPLIVSNVFDAASGENYLGVADGESEVFLPSFGDVVSLELPMPVTSLAVSFVSTPAPPVGAYGISTPVGGAVSAAVPDAVLGDGGEVYRVAFTSLTPFSVADLSGGTSGLHSFNIDDIEFMSGPPTGVPEPTSIVLLAVGLLGALFAVLLDRNRPHGRAVAARKL